MCPMPTASVFWLELGETHLNVKSQLKCDGQATLMEHSHTMIFSFNFYNSSLIFSDVSDDDDDLIPHAQVFHMSKYASQIASSGT